MISGIRGENFSKLTWNVRQNAFKDSSFKSSLTNFKLFLNIKKKLWLWNKNYIHTRKISIIPPQMQNILHQYKTFMIKYSISPIFYTRYSSYLLHNFVFSYISPYGTQWKKNQYFTCSKLIFIIHCKSFNSTWKLETNL